MQFLIQIFFVLFPLCSIAGSGYVYARYQGVHRETLSQLCTNFFMPALLFHTLATMTIQPFEYGITILLSAVVVLGSAPITIPIILLFKQRLRTFVPSMMFNNAGNVGLPIALVAFEETGFQFMLIFFVVESCLHVTLVYYILGQRGFLFLLRQPFIIAILAALIYRQSPFQLHAAVLTTIEMLANVALPLMIFTLGARLHDLAGNVFKYFKEGIFVGLLCPLSGLFSILIGLAILDFFAISISPLAREVLLFAAILPPAVSNFIFAEKFNQEPQKTASFVMLSNLMCLIIIPLFFFFIW